MNSLHQKGGKGALAVQASKSLNLDPAEVYEELKSEVAKLFNNDMRKEFATFTDNEIDPKARKARLRVASIVYCKKIQKVSFSFMRLGIIADKGLKKLVEEVSPILGLHFTPLDEVKSKIIKVNGWEVEIFGKADLGWRHPEWGLIPIEFKASTREETIQRGRIQAGVYAWLYDSPFAVVMYGNDLRVDVVLPFTDEEIALRVRDALKGLMGPHDEFNCHKLEPKILPFRTRSLELFQRRN